MQDTLLSVADLSVERGGRIVLSRLSFSLRAGETLLVTGRNGAGKSTLLRTLCGLLHANAGAIRYAGTSDEARGVESVHYLGYEDALKPTLTVGENLAFWTVMLATPAAASPGSSSPAPPPSEGPDGAVGQALAAFGIGRLCDLPAAYLSAGQKRRVALAKLLLAPRPIWLLDEPLIALDTGAQAILCAHMAAHVAAGGAILVASHQPLAIAHRELDLHAAQAQVQAQVQAAAVGGGMA